ncbi:MAG: hypothetical protein LQ337_000559 [Flavoplaca oasis]|nr:MAG: hypothetical protein LQ337_000559 [Flavoplaca oasis]
MEPLRKRDDAEGVRILWKTKEEMNAIAREGFGMLGNGATSSPMCTLTVKSAADTGHFKRPRTGGIISSSAKGVAAGDAILASWSTVPVVVEPDGEEVTLVGGRKKGARKLPGF